MPVGIYIIALKQYFVAIRVLAKFLLIQSECPFTAALNAEIYISSLKIVIKNSKNITGIMAGIRAVVMLAGHI